MILHKKMDEMILALATSTIYLLGSALAIWILLSWIVRKKRSKFPVAKGFPIIGSGLDIKPTNLLKTAFSNPAKYGPVYEFNIPGSPGFFIGDPELIREILMKRPKKLRRRKANQYSSNIMGTNNGLFDAAGATWSHMRRATAPSFSLQNVKNKFHTIIVELKAWMDRMREREGEIFDMKYESFSMTIRVITSVAFGLATDDPVVSYFVSEQFLKDTNAMFRFSGEHRLFPFPKFLWKYSPSYKYEVAAVQAAERVKVACEQLISHKKTLLKAGQIKEHAMIDSLIDRDDSDALSQDDLIANMKTFFLAGSETTSVAITWLIFILSQYPEVKAKIRTEVEEVLIKGRGYEDIIQIVTFESVAKLTYCTAVAKEVLRRFGSVATLSFEVEDIDGEVEIAKDIFLKRGELVWINIEYANNHPEVFAPDPRTFRPERWLIDDADKLSKMETGFLPFGSGPRVCPGMNLALHEIIPAVALLGYYFDMELACPVNEIERVVSFTATANKMPIYAKFCQR